MSEFDKDLLGWGDLDIALNSDSKLIYEEDTNIDYQIEFSSDLLFLLYINPYFVFSRSII